MSGGAVDPAQQARMQWFFRVILFVMGVSQTVLGVLILWAAQNAKPSESGEMMADLLLMQLEQSTAMILGAIIAVVGVLDVIAAFILAELLAPRAGAGSQSSRSGQGVSRSRR